MQKKYKVFRFDSHNSGFYVAQDLSLKDGREIAIRLSKTNYPKARVESESVRPAGNYYQFELYENGEKTEWSLLAL